MKLRNCFFLTICIISAYVSQAQLAYYSMTSEGGDYGIGTIFKTDIDGTNPVKVYDFKTEFVGQNAYHLSLLEVNDGFLYGLTANGGRYNRGVLFRYNPTTKSYDDLHSFDGDDGKNPYGSVIQAVDGMIYGMCFAGGVDDKGTVFRFDIVNGKFEKIFDLADHNASSPYNRLFQHSNGNIYGMTSSGGTNTSGVLFGFNPSDLSFNIMHNFEETTGRNPRGSLIEMNNQLYGMTTFGGANKNGVIFSYDPSNNQYIVRAAFDNLNEMNGSIPLGNLTAMSNGKLYGLTRNGGEYNMGVIFEYDPATQTITNKDDFSNRRGRFPLGDLVVKDDQTLIGLASEAGLSQAGSLFSFNLQDDSLYITKYFQYRNGFKPYGSPTITMSGHIYGVTSEGGFNNQGVLFEYDANMDSILVEVNFNHATQGSNPCGTLFQATNGKMYGLTRYGGENLSYGTIFMLDPKTDEYTKLADLDLSTGVFPFNSFIEGDDRILYAMTWAGGDSTEGGAIIGFDIKTNTLTTEATFNFRNGARPYADLTRAENGKYYGLTSIGGADNRGVLFEFDPNIDTVMIKYHFNKDNKMGYIPYGSLTSDGNGNLYGMTNLGGNLSKGCIFKYEHQTEQYSVLESFGGRISGANPGGNVLLYDNNLYGMNREAGDNRAGVIFELNLETNRYTKVFVFDSINGRNPNASLTLTRDNKILGFASNGGEYGVGTAFEFTPGKRNSFVKLYDFDFDLGAYPIYGFPAFSDATITSAEKINNVGSALTISPNPAKSVVHIHGLKEGELIQQIDCYNVDGKLLISQKSNHDKFNISNLNHGNYILQVLTNKGYTSMKFLKN